MAAGVFVSASGHLRLPPARVVLTGAAAVALLVLVKSAISAASLAPDEKEKEKILPSPRTTLLPKLSAAEAAALPYPPEGLFPEGSARDVDSPYGCLRVYEWGPVDGEKVLLVHGISTPCVALAGVAGELVRRGRRVMLFDLFGRGYSDAPADLPYDSRLYTTQILLALSSSPIPWTGHGASFSIVGYSLGGGVAADFASYFPDLVSSLVLIAPGGIIREQHVSRKSKLLYNSGSILPQRLVHWLVSRRLYTEPDDPANPRTTSSTTVSAENAAQAEAGQHYHVPALSSASSSSSPSSSAAEETSPIAASYEDIGAASGLLTPTSGGGVSAAASGLLPPQRRGSMASHPAQLFPGRPAVTAANAVNWQLAAHPGFVSAFISSIRFAPVYGQHARWRVLGQHLAERRRRGRRGKVLLVLGRADPIIVEEEIRRDSADVLGGEEAVEAVVLEAGHEVPMSLPAEVVRAMVGFWGEV